MTDYAVGPFPTQARARLGNKDVGVTFPFNPDTVQWDYKENIASWDTLGGRVVQLLSVSLNGMMVEGRAGSRSEFQKMAKKFKEIMGYHVRTLNPVQFVVPSRNWRFDVYLEAVPQMGWEVASTSYPYALSFRVESDLNGIKTKEVSVDALQRLASGIGFDNSSLVHGGNIQEFSQIIDIMTDQPFFGGGAQVAGAGAGGVSAEDCTGANCTVAAFCTGIAQEVGLPTSNDVITFLVAWAAKEGGSVNNDYDYNLFNIRPTSTSTEGICSRPLNNFNVYCTFLDGVKSTANVMRLSYYKDVMARLKANDISGAAQALEESPWCAGPCSSGSNSHSCCGYAAAIMNIYKSSAASYGRNTLP